MDEHRQQERRPAAAPLLALRAGRDSRLCPLSFHARSYSKAKAPRPTGAEEQVRMVCRPTAAVISPLSMAA